MYKAIITIEETADGKVAITFAPSVRHVVGDKVNISAAENLFTKVLAAIKSLEKVK